MTPLEVLAAVFPPAECEARPTWHACIAGDGRDVSCPSGAAGPHRRCFHTPNGGES